jgi:hypothetical protein
MLGFVIYDYIYSDVRAPWCAEKHDGMGWMIGVPMGKGCGSENRYEPIIDHQTLLTHQ